MLPPIRKLAARLHLNPNTVARAYAELARAGRLIKRVGCGCFVAPAQDRGSEAERLQPLADRIEELVHDAHALGITTETLLRAVRRIGESPAPVTELVENSRRREPGKVASVKPPVPAAKPDPLPAAAASLWPAAGFVD